MTFNSINTYVGNHRVWDHVGSLFPNVEKLEGQRVSPYLVARWLPVQYFDKHYENYIVIMPGKAVALDPHGRVVPAGLKILAEIDTSSDLVVYTQDDVDAGTIDVTTGVPVTQAAVTAASGSLGYTISEINTAGFLGVADKTLVISAPIGVAPYAYLQAADDDELADPELGPAPSDLRNHNYNMQHAVAVLTDYVIEVPLVPGAVSSAESIGFAAPSGNVAVSSGVANLPMAAHSARTPITFAGGSSSTLFVNQVASADEVTSSGDYFVDLSTGFVHVFATSTPSSITVTYSHYAASPTTVSAFAAAAGDLKPGDMVTIDKHSNFVKATRTSLSLAASSFGNTFKDEVVRALGLVVGQVIRVETYPRSALERVKTAYNPTIKTKAKGAKPGTLGQYDQMPGSANGGVPDFIHFSGASDRAVWINLTTR